MTTDLAGVSLNNFNNFMNEGVLSVFNTEALEVAGVVTGIYTALELNYISFSKVIQLIPGYFIGKWMGGSAQEIFQSRIGSTKAYFANKLITVGVTGFISKLNFRTFLSLGSIVSGRQQRNATKAIMITVFTASLALLRLSSQRTQQYVQTLSGIVATCVTGFYMISEIKNLYNAIIGNEDLEVENIYEGRKTVGNCLNELRNNQKIESYLRGLNVTCFEGKLSSKWLT